jgi:hypothetical protein
MYLRICCDVVPSLLQDLKTVIERVEVMLIEMVAMERMLMYCYTKHILERMMWCQTNIAGRANVFY